MQTWRGLTLIELVIAIAVFSLIGTAAYGGLVSVLEARSHAAAHAERLAQTQHAIDTLGSDLLHAAPRMVRAADNNQQDAMHGAAGSLALSRSGWPNPAGLRQSGLARVTWRQEEGRLLRQWRVFPDAVVGTPATERIMLDDLAHFDPAFLAADGEWHEQWPPTTTTEPVAQLPCAVRVRLELADWGQIERLYPMPDRFPAQDVSPCD